MFLQNELLNLFDDMFEDKMFSSMNIPDIMRTDAYELDGNLIMEVELPGYEKEEIRAELKDGYLTIMAARPQQIEMEETHRNYLRRERYFGGCKRSYYVGDEISQRDIKAAFKDGILTVLIRIPERRIQDNRKWIEY